MGTITLRSIAIYTNVISVHLETHTQLCQYWQNLALKKATHWAALFNPHSVKT